MESVYIPAYGEVAYFFSPETNVTYRKDQIFITLCEVKPGIIWAAGYGSDILQINKRKLSVELLDISEMKPEKVRGKIYMSACQGLTR